LAFNRTDLYLISPGTSRKAPHETQCRIISSRSLVASGIRQWSFGKFPAFCRFISFDISTRLRAGRSGFDCR